MPVDDERRVLYLHVPKTGGTSVEHALGMLGRSECDLGRAYGALPDRRSLQHMNLPELLEAGLVRAEELAKMVVFATVRHPWQRFVSHCRWHGRLHADPWLVARFAERVCAQCYRSLLDRYGAAAVHLRPQIDYLEGGPTLVRWEDVARVGTLAAVPGLGRRDRLPRLNPARHDWELSGEEQRALRERVEEIYARDYVALGYPRSGRGELGRARG